MVVPARKVKLIQAPAFSEFEVSEVEFRSLRMSGRYVGANTEFMAPRATLKKENVKRIYG